MFFWSLFFWSLLGRMEPLPISKGATDMQVESFIGGAAIVHRADQELILRERLSDEEPLAGSPHVQ